MKNYFTILTFATIIMLIMIVLFCKPFIISAQSSSQQLNIGLNVTPESYCNSNGVCEPLLGENTQNCSSDCGCNNDGVCESSRGENNSNCPGDCPCNNNGICEPSLGENTQNCSSDCGCNSDGVCESDRGEDGSSCPSDCGCNNNGVCESSRGENAQNCGDCVVAVSGNEGTGIGSFLTIYGVSAEPGINSANIYWQTNLSAVCKVFWGKTSQYENKTIAETTSDVKHLVNFDNLEMQIIYHYKISCLANQTTTADTGDITFNLPYTVNNISNFIAKAGDQNIVLSWTNPKNIGSQKVIIIRNDKDYPSNIQDGTDIYQGSGNSFKDVNLINGTTYYYAIFTIDENNNSVWTALASATPFAKNIPIPTPKPPSTINPAPASIPSIPSVLGQITINDFNFYASGINIPVKNNKAIEVFQNTSLNISTDCAKFPDNNIILVTLQNKDKTTSLILKKENQKDSCNVVLVSPQISGIYPLKISITNSNNETIGQIDAELKVLSKNQQPLWFGSAMAYGIYTLITSIATFFVIWFLIFKIINPIRY